MTNPITPPRELVEQWLSEFYDTTIAPGEAAIYVATQAAQWGYQQAVEELETFLIKGNDAH